MSDSVQSPSVLVVTDNTELVSSLIESNTTEHTFQSRESMQIALEEQDLLNNNGIVIFDIDSVDGGKDAAIDQSLKLKQTDPTQVLILVGEPETLAEILKSNIQPLIYRAFNKPIHPNQIFLSFKSAAALHFSLVEKEAAGEDITVVGPEENRTSVGSLAEQRNNKPVIYAAVGVVALAAIAWLLFGGSPETVNETSVVTTEQTTVPNELVGLESDSISKVNKLNQLAATAILEGRYISPRGDNALDYYNQVLSIDAYDNTAYQGKKSVADALRGSFDQRLENAEFDGALDIINGLQSIEPLSTDNDILRKRLEASIAKHVKEIKETGSAEEIDRTAAVLKKIESESAGSKSASAALLKEKTLVAKIDAALDADNLIPPQKDNAYSLVSDALKKNTISNANFEPRIKALSDKLIGASARNLEAEELEEAEKLAALVKRLGVDRKGLAALAKSINTRKAEIAAASSAAADEAAKAEAEAKEPEEVKIIPAKIISRVAPRYPNRALDKGLEGWVDIGFTISIKGEPYNIKVNSSDPEGTFDNAAIKAVKKWRFSPARNEQTGLPVESNVTSTKLQFRIG